MAGWLAALPIIGKAFDNATEIVKKVVVDKDKQNQIIGALETAKHAVYIAELHSKTVPWVDALHKMGRLITNWSLIVFVLLSKQLGWELDQNVIFLLGGGNIVYQLIKGKGR